MQVTGIDKLAGAVSEILQDYADGILDSMQAVSKKAAAKAKATLKTTSPKSSGQPSYSSKHYADQWAAKDEASRTAYNSTVYNKAPTYRLTHLLENGYVTRSGKRVAGRPHIKPVEETVINEVMKGIKEAAVK